MPMMLRIEGKPKKIAYAVNGVPLNILSKRTARQREIDKQIVYKNTYRIK